MRGYGVLYLLYECLCCRARLITVLHNLHNPTSYNHPIGYIDYSASLLWGSDAEADTKRLRSYIPHPG